MKNLHYIPRPSYILLTSGMFTGMAIQLVVRRSGDLDNCSVSKLASVCLLIVVRLYLSQPCRSLIVKGKSPHFSSFSKKVNQDTSSISTVNTSFYIYAESSESFHGGYKFQQLQSTKNYSSLPHIFVIITSYFRHHYLTISSSLPRICSLQIGTRDVISKLGYTIHILQYTCTEDFALQCFICSVLHMTMMFNMETVL